MTTERIEDYLEAIYLIECKKGYAKAKDISKILGVSPSSVTEMFQKLSDNKYINYEKYGGATLTANGKDIAKMTWEKHKILRDFFIMLGVEEDVANRDACRMEHVVNPETVDRLRKLVEFVRQFKEKPLWLDHFKYYYDTGKFVDCTPSTMDQCPVHGKKR
ncbi:MAG: metal-dependent transcriptional regulator [Methermicoccaceae archaeon]